MGQMIPVNVLEILSLAWDHPLIAGLVMLMFTPPFFPVVVFFSPLLISTALCAVALISVGHQIEEVRVKRANEIAGWNARVVEGDLWTARESVMSRRRLPGAEERWLDWVQGFEPGSFLQTDSKLMEDIKEEGLMVDFGSDDGGINMMEEEFRQQIEAFKEYEKIRTFGDRSFSFRSGHLAAVPTIDASEPAPSFMEMVPFQTEPDDIVSTKPQPQIPPMFLYTLRTGGTGSANANAPVSGGRAPAAAAGPGAAGAGGAVEDGGRERDSFALVQQQQRSILEAYNNSRKMQVSSVALMRTHDMGVEADNFSFESHIVPERSPVGAMGEWKLGRNVSSRAATDLVRSKTAASTAVALNPSGEGCVKGLTYNNASQFPGNAVIYTASSNNVGPLQRKLSNRGRIGLASRHKRRHVAREQSYTDLFPLEAGPSRR